MGSGPSKEEVTKEVEGVLSKQVLESLHPTERDLLKGETTLTILVAGLRHAGKSALINTIHRVLRKETGELKRYAAVSGNPSAHTTLEVSYYQVHKKCCIWFCSMRCVTVVGLVAM